MIVGDVFYIPNNEPYQYVVLHRVICCDSESKFKILFAQKTQMFVIFSVALNDSNFTMAEQFCLFRFSALICSTWLVMLTPMQDGILS